MTDDDPQFEDADAAVTRAVTTFVSEIESIFGSGKTQSLPRTSSRAPWWSYRLKCPS